jgi:high-affinity nickel-transport protein
MTAIDLPTGGLVLLFLLGLRHGIEPDHIAAIDAMTLRALDQREPHAAWIGALFALGHGAVVIVLALGVSLLSTSIHPPPAVALVVDWLPVVLLLLLGAWNLKALLAPGVYRPDSLRLKLMPRAWRQRTDIWSALVIGALFATVVDTLAHVTAWSVFATNRGGPWAGVLAGLLFSAGMLIVSAADSQLICRLLRDGTATDMSARIRQGIGWFVVLLSFAVAGTTAASLLEANMSFVEGALAWLAAASFAVVFIVWRRRREQVVNSVGEPA